MKNVLYVKHCARPWEYKRRNVSSIKVNRIYFRPLPLNFVTIFVVLNSIFYWSLLSKWLLPFIALISPAS